MRSLLCDSGYTGQPLARSVREIGGGHVTLQIAKRSQLHPLHVMPRRWIAELPVLEVLLAKHLVADLTLGLGIVVRAYLA